MNNTTATPPSTAADREALGTLHKLLVDSCLHYMASTPVEKRTAVWLELIRSLLRDNGCKADMLGARDMQASMQELRDAALPFH